MYIPDFDYHRPNTLDDAYLLLNKLDNPTPIAGGTDLLVEIKQGIKRTENIISLAGIKELKGITEDADSITINAGVTHSELIASPLILKYFPALSQTAGKIGTHQIQNTGTIGGNLCTCASCADTAPILLVYNAEILIGSLKGTRTMNLNEFFIGHHITILEKDELLLSIRLLKKKTKFCSWFEKFGLRESASISVASVAVGFEIDNNIVTNASVVVGACAPTPVKSISATEKLLGSNINQLNQGSDVLSGIGDAASKEVLPIDDIRASADYRRNIVSTITQRAIIKALNQNNSN